MAISKKFSTFAVHDKSYVERLPEEVAVPVL